MSHIYHGHEELEHSTDRLSIGYTSHVTCGYEFGWQSQRFDVSDNELAHNSSFDGSDNELAHNSSLDLEASQAGSECPPSVS